jgi:uncharacterized protein (TIGR03437 family)
MRICVLCVVSLALNWVVRAQSSTDPVFVPGSSQKVCQPNGEFDHETGLPTISQTESNYGLISADVGTSFNYKNQIWFLFGDANPTGLFNGKPNGIPPRTFQNNDAPAYTVGTDVTQCLKMEFVRDSIGAYKNPEILTAPGQAPVTLGIDEYPVDGIEEGGRMFILAATDNFELIPAPPNLGYATRTVIAVSDDDGVTFHYLYDFSAPSCSRCDGAKFVTVKSVGWTDGYVYFFGTQGGHQFRSSQVFLARKLATTLAQAGGIQYLTGLNSAGTPNWSSAEADAVALFQDYIGGTSTPTSCMGELGAEYNKFVNRWVMTYNCFKGPGETQGDLIRFAPQPWGPWSPAQILFNPTRDRGFCHFIHRAVTAATPACDTVNDNGREADGGSYYAPEIISQFTSGNAADGTSTFYWTLATWNPYGQVIMKSTIQAATSTAPVIGLVANAEGESYSIAPNTWVEIKGLNLAKPGSGRTWQSADFAGGQMPTQLDGVSVTVNGKAAYVYYISPTQVNILTPPDDLSGPVQVVLTNSGVTASYTAQTQPASPSFFVFDTVADVIATHADGSLIGPTTLYPGMSRPAKAGETIVIYANGFGHTTVPVTRGSVNQGGTLSPLPAVKIGGVNATVVYAGLVSPGQFQFNVVVPQGLTSGYQTISAALNGVTTQGNALIAVQ